LDNNQGLSEVNNSEKIIINCQFRQEKQGRDLVATNHRKRKSLISIASLEQKTSLQNNQGASWLLNQELEKLAFATAKNKAGLKAK
jgi:predicted ATP-dependent serine protease